MSHLEKRKLRQIQEEKRQELAQDQETKTQGSHDLSGQFSLHREVAKAEGCSR